MAEAPQEISRQEDAGAAFVLQSKGPPSIFVLSLILPFKSQTIVFSWILC